MDDPVAIATPLTLSRKAQTDNMAILVNEVARIACQADSSSDQASSREREGRCTADFQGPVDSTHWLKSRTGTLRSVGEKDY
jgi:hypothetical protein